MVLPASREFGQRRQFLHSAQNNKNFDISPAHSKKGVMVKFVYVVRRRPDLSPAAFRKYWLENHGPLVRKLAQALRAKRYVQSHTLDTPMNQIARHARGAQAPYDGLTELWFDKIEDLFAAAQTPEGQQANLTLAQDEAKFCDLPNCSVFFTEEHAIL
jgi:uncharacterized protein (TIGR02118 family)